jgi:Flp pilus assembly protein TadD
MTDRLQRARELALAGRSQEAEALLAAMLDQSPNDQAALHLLASIAEHGGDRVRAAKILQRAAEAHPRNFVVVAHLASVMRALGRFDDAVNYGLRAADLKPNDPVVLNDLAIALMARGDYDAAERHLRRALELDPSLPDPYNNLGLIAQQLGRLDEAVAYFGRFLALRPQAAYAYVNLMDSYTVRSAEDPNLQEVERRLAQVALRDSDRMLLLFAAAKANIDLGRLRHALQCALEACMLKRRSIRYDEAATLRLFAEMRSVMSADRFRRLEGSGFSSSKPIFIVSMPRAGSTLVEQILSSHGSVHGAGELPDFPNAVAAVLGADLGAALQSAAAPDALSRIGRTYVDAIGYRAPNAARITDKMPTNFLMAGLIHLALPDAKIVHVRRDPVDTCVSCFTRHFTEELNHTYDLAELGRYYRAYNDLMEHWRRVLPAGVMLEVEYEKLTGNLEGEASRLLTFCGLPWNEAVLRFHQNARPVQTHSVAQVRRPLYQSSIGRWRAFDDLLQPLLRELGELAAPAGPR